MNKLAVVEGLLFVVGDEGITLEQICKILEVEEEEARKILKELQTEYGRNIPHFDQRITAIGSDHT